MIDRITNPPFLFFVDAIQEDRRTALLVPCPVEILCSFAGLFHACTSTSTSDRPGG